MRMQAARRGPASGPDTRAFARVRVGHCGNDHRSARHLGPP